MGRKTEMTLVAAEQPQLRQVAPRDWSQKKAEAFLSVLAETCNVSEACRESGVSMTTAYRRRKIDAAFRAAWLEAIGVAYQRLELMLLDRAFNGTEKVTTRRDGSEERMREYPNQLGLQLLKMHRDTATEADMQFEPSQVEEMKARLFDKLRRLKIRDEQDRVQPA